MEHKGMKIMAKNRQVYHDYFVEKNTKPGLSSLGPRSNPSAPVP